MPEPHSEMSAAMRRLAETLRQLATSLADLSAALGETLYRNHAQPFGPSPEACRIWGTFRQYTTAN